MVNFSFRSKTVFHSLPAVDPLTLPISKIELFMTITNDFRPLTIVKISAEYLNPNMATKDDYYHCWHFWQVLDCFFSASDRYWIDPKHVSDRLFVFIKNKNDQSEMHIGKNVVRYVSNSSWSRTITNKNTYWTFIIFNFETVITFFIFECYLWLLDFFIDFSSTILYLNFAYF